MIEREWMQKRDEEDRAWRERQTREDREWREEQASKEERRHRVNLLVYGLLAICAGIVGSMIQAAWIQKPAVLNPPSHLHRN